ncbi:MAG: L-2-hydroxyglutarate oxidase [Candidatus Omnitrophica bacterium]|nr:L-2-hydroxyglutarate oxidase [Candidatus Omnitrophota bacterium]
MSTTIYDLAVIGGGIVGLATAREFLTRFPGASVVVLEKEPQVASHQSSHNSGVIHSGIYYRPGSLKATTCVVGASLMVEFCQAHRIPYEICGKVIVATEASEVPALERLYQRGAANGVKGVSLIGPERLRELEPHARGIKALHVASTGIVEYAAVARVLGELIQRRGGRIRPSTQVRRLVRRDGAWLVQTTSGELQARVVVTCAGLYADRLARMAHAPDDLRIVPFRGEYYELVPPRRFLVKNMIYPVPDPTLPFLGVHFTRAIGGGVHAGPNAVLALKREGYRKTDVSLADTFTMLQFPGFWRMSRRYWSVGVREWGRSLSRRTFVQALRRLVPEISPQDLVPGVHGVRAQAVDRGGALLDDFNIVPGDGAVYVRNVPSPAATASLRIAQLIADEVGAILGAGRRMR